jgi:hypothetical protein
MTKARNLIESAVAGADPRQLVEATGMYGEPISAEKAAGRVKQFADRLHSEVSGGNTVGIVRDLAMILGEFPDLLLSAGLDRKAPVFGAVKTAQKAIDSSRF